MPEVKVGGKLDELSESGGRLRRKEMCRGHKKK